MVGLPEVDRDLEGGVSVLNSGKVRLFIGLLVIITILAVPVFASDKPQDAKINLDPSDNQGHKFRLAYCETEPFTNYAGTFYGLLKGLEKLGWISNIEGLEYIQGQSDTKAMWNWLATHDVSPYLEFVGDAHFTLSLMEGEQPETMVIQRLQNQDIDLIIGMGTRAGKAVANDQHQVPVAVFSTSNAVRSGIIKEENDSGNPHVWAHMDSRLYQRQISVFHDIFQFKKMGMVYENSSLGRIYAAVDDAHYVLAEQGAKVVTYPIQEPVDADDRERYYADLLRIHQKLANEVDAMYLTMAPIESARLPQLLEPFYAKKIPVFSQLGTEEVQCGALISVARADFSGIGQFGAENIIYLLKGKSARELPQVFENVPHIALNLEIAKRIGFKPPFEILLVADEIFQRVDTGSSN